MVFVASNMPTGYPWKLQKPSTIGPKVRDTAAPLILDSGIGEDVTTSEILDLAEKYDPQYVVAKDELYEHEVTIENTLDLLDELPERDTKAIPLVPLQPPYDEHYEKLREIGLTDHKFVLGGMAVDSVDTAQQLEWIHRFREVAPDAYAHGLGVGGGIEFVEKVAGRNLLDSIDCATPEMAAINGCVLDGRLRQNEVMSFAGGEGRCNRTYPLAEFNSWQIHDVWNREANQKHDLAAYQ